MYSIRCLTKKDIKKINKRGLNLKYKKNQLYCMVDENGKPLLAGDESLLVYKTKSKDKATIVLGLMEYFRNYGVYSTIADVSIHCGESLNPSFVGLFYSPFSSNFKLQKHISNIIVGKVIDESAKEALTDMTMAVKSIISQFEDDLINETPTLSCKQAIIQQGFIAVTKEKEEIEEPTFEVISRDDDDELCLEDTDDEMDEIENDEQEDREEI